MEGLLLQQIVQLIKMETKNKILTGFIGFVLVLAGFGGNMLLTPDQFENAYVCDLTEEVGIFLGGISGTAYSGYPNLEDRKGSIKCGTTDNKGKWISLVDYAKEEGIDPLNFIIKSVEENKPVFNGFDQEICSPPPENRCVVI